MAVGERTSALFIAVVGRMLVLVGHQTALSGFELGCRHYAYYLLRLGIMFKAHGGGFPCVFICFSR